MSAKRIIVAGLAGALFLCGASSEAQAPRVNGYALKEPTTPEEIAAAKPNPHSPGFRVPLPSLEQMDPAMRADFESNARRLKTPVPTTAPLMLTPDIKSALSAVQNAVANYNIPKDVEELTILMIARNWGAHFEWWVHAPQAEIEGVPAAAVEAIRTGRRPTFADARQEATYRYFLEMLRDHEVTDATYENLRKLLGTEQVVAVTELGGYYGRLAMAMIAHKLPLRTDVKPPLPKLTKPFPS